MEHVAEVRTVSAAERGYSISHSLASSGMHVALYTYVYNGASSSRNIGLRTICCAAATAAAAAAAAAAALATAAAAAAAVATAATAAAASTNTASRFQNISVPFNILPAIRSSPNDILRRKNPVYYWSTDAKRVYLDRCLPA